MFPKFDASIQRASSSFNSFSALQSESRFIAYFPVCLRDANSWLDMISPTYSKTNAPAGKVSKVLMPHSLWGLVQKTCTEPKRVVNRFWWTWMLLKAVTYKRLQMQCSPAAFGLYHVASLDLCNDFCKSSHLRTPSRKNLLCALHILHTPNLNNWTCHSIHRDPHLHPKFPFVSTIPKKDIIKLVTPTNRWQFKKHQMTHEN